MALSPALAQRTIVRLRAPVVVNRYGDDERDWTPAGVDRLTITGCALQPAGTDSSADASRSPTTTRWSLFVPPGADLAGGDRVEVDGVVYQLDGDVQTWAQTAVLGEGILDHVVATLQRIEG